MLVVGIERQCAGCLNTSNETLLKIGQGGNFQSFGVTTQIREVRNVDQLVVGFRTGFGLVHQVRLGTVGFHSACSHNLLPPVKFFSIGAPNVLSADTVNLCIFHVRNGQLRSPSEIHGVHNVCDNGGDFLSLGLRADLFVGVDIECEHHVHTILSVRRSLTTGSQRVIAHFAKNMRECSGGLLICAGNIGFRIIHCQCIGYPRINLIFRVNHI
nr:MAG TPA: hypothetical protein [Caudoviricetes sp.]